MSQKKVEPWKLYTMVSCLLIVDFVILITWQIQDPLERTLESFPLEDPISVSDDIKIRPELEHCESENNSIWLGKWDHRFPPCAASCRRLCSLLLTSSLFLWYSPSAVVGAIRKSVYIFSLFLSFGSAFSFPAKLQFSSDESKKWDPTMKVHLSFHVYNKEEKRSRIFSSIFN